MQQAITLLTLNELIRDTLDTHMEPGYWVIAEIAELKHATQGHAYLDLVEKNGNKISAKMRANIWAYTYRSISGKFQNTTGQSLKSGMKVLALVAVTFHELYGFSLNIKDIDPNFTLGERARLRQEVIDRLTQEGHMETNKRCKLPAVPQKIAIISSATAAGYGDFINQIDKNRFGYSIHRKFYQATMQGSDAVPSIIQAFDQIQNDQIKEKFDGVVLIRGGGAQLDLDCFDDYELALSIANCNLPVLTGIGHERDETIADLVAHTRLKTPTAVAEFILSGFQEFEENLLYEMKLIERHAQAICSSESKSIQDLEGKLRNVYKNQIQQGHESLKYKKEQILSFVRYRVSIENMKLNNFQKDIRTLSQNKIQQAKNQLLQFDKEIKVLNPQTFFEKGYTRTELNGVPIHLANPKEGDQLESYTQKTKISSIIKKIEDHE
ncbi:exodeoxyribonuclease VII large subunit [Indibacter alkaliphilus]|nr:exodeoxyribonuclease VII large subunit [Indibacter alkaliphilus]